jgi:ABC-type transport system involved in cytochrome bd biosynthesis fused ATPase/permease subunit
MMKMVKSFVDPLLILEWYSDASCEERSLQSKMFWLEQLARSSNSRPEVSIFGAKDWIVQYYTSLSETITALRETGKLDVKLRNGTFIHQHIFPLIHSGARALMYLTVAFQPDYFGMPISQLTFLESSVDGVFTSISALRSSLSTRLFKDMFRIRNLFECMEMKSRVPLPENPTTYISDPRGMKVQFKDVSFRYKKDSPNVLKNVSFTVEPGQIVSIVGYNGSGNSILLNFFSDLGKTTLIRLLTLLEKPSSGDIYINDVKMSDYNPKILISNMSVLFQDFRNSKSKLLLISEKYLSLSAQENIGFGRASHMNKLDVIRQAATDSGAHDYIRSFESFYQTSLYVEHNTSDMPYDHYYSYYIDPDEKRDIPFMVKVLSDDLLMQSKCDDKVITWGSKPGGKEIDITIPEYKPSKNDEGVSARSLSGGQWQRIALARAFMKIKEADLLILDEPSSALDPQAEYEVFKTIMELRKNKTTIYIVRFIPLEIANLSLIDFILFAQRQRSLYEFFIIVC